MKRTFTLLLAALVAGATYALPLKPAEGPSTQRPVRTETTAALVPASHTVAAPAKLEKKAELSAERKAQVDAWNKRHAFERNVITENAKRASKPAASAEEGQVIELVAGVNFLTNFEYYPETGDWYIGFGDVTGDYIVKFDWVNWDPENPYGTFTIDDWDLGYSYIVDYINSVYVFYEEGELTFSQEVVSDKLSRIKLDATVTCDDGNTYHIVGVEETFTPTDTVQTTIHNGTFDYDTEEWILLADGIEGDNSIMLVTAAESLVGSIDPTYVDLENTEIVIDGEDVNILKVVGLEANLNEDLTDYVIELSLISADTALHEIELHCAVPEGETIEATLPNLVIDDSWYAWFGLVFIEASNSDIEVSLTTIGTEGTFSIAEGTLAGTLTAGGAALDLLSATLVIEADINGEVSADLECLATDFNTYKLHMAWIVPDPIRSVDVEFATSARVNVYPSQGLLVIWNENDNQYVRLGVLDWAPNKKLDVSRDNLYDYYCLFINYVDGAERYEEIADVNGTLEQDGDTLRLNAAVICRDSVQYNVKLWYAVPEPTATVEVPAIKDADFINVLSAGQYQVVGATQDGAYEVSFTTASTYVVPGTYKYTADFTSTDLDLRYSYIANIAAGEDYSVLTAEVAVTLDENNVVTATGWYICDNAVKYTFTLVSEFEKERIDGDETEIPANVVMTADTYEYVISDKYFAIYGELDFEALGAELDYLWLTFIPEALDDATVIPVGTYEINNTYEVGTVTAGATDGWYLYASIYLSLDEEGYLDSTKPLYYLVEGTVTVETEEGGLHIVVDALNSYDVPVKIDIHTGEGGGTAIENTNADEVKIVKFVKNGQLLIQRGNKVFNVLGAEL